MRQKPKNIPRAAAQQSDVPAAKEASAISRRAFVKKGSGTLLVLGGIACSDTTVDPTSLGTIQLTLTGLHPSAVSGGTATATPTTGGEQVQITIPAAGDQSRLVPAGVYAVSYTPPPNHSLAPGTTVPSTVTITQGQTTTVTVDLVSAGSIQVTVTGLTGGPANGGTATAQRTDAAGTPIPINISVAGSGVASNVPSGTYSVTYSPPAGFNSTGTNPVTGLLVGPGVAASAGFSVGVTAAQTGDIHVTVNGLTGAPSGGSVSARLTNNSGSTFSANLSAPSGGSSTADLTGLPVGSYNVTYTVPGGFRLVSGQANPQVANVTSGATVNATFNAEVIPVGTGNLFFSDFRTELGLSANAKTDGGKWNILADNSGGLEVIASGALGFPSPNCLRVTARQANTGFHRIAKTGLGIVGPGESVWFRWYYRNEQPSLGDNSQHPIESGQTGGLDWAFNNEVQSNTTWYGDFQSLGDTLTFKQRWRGPLLQSSTIYRFEFQLHKLTTQTWNLHIRIYDGAGTQIAGDADYRNVFSGGGVAANAVSLADLPTLNFSTANGSQMDELRGGNNGIGGSDWFPSVLHSYQGCFAVSRAGWIGPWNPTSG